MEHSTDPREITTQFEKLLAGLVTDGVDFAVVDGPAIIFNGYPRFTFDADILAHDSLDNLRKLLDSLAKWG